MVRGSVSRFAVSMAAVLISGLLLAAGTFSSTLSLLTWIALVPVLIVLRWHKSGIGFFFAFIAGAAYYAIAFRWTVAFHVLAIFVVAGVSSVFFFAFPLMLVRHFLVGRLGIALIIIPSVWTAFEYIKRTWKLRFPFGILGYSQSQQLTLIQIADIGGVELVSWLILFSNVALFLFIEKFISKRDIKMRIRTTLLYIGALVVIFACVSGYGFFSIHRIQYESTPTLKVAFVQTLFHPRKEWGAHQEEYLKTILGYSRDLSGVGADLVLFPELTIDKPLTFDPKIRVPQNTEILNSLSSAAADGRTNILFGCLEVKELAGKIQTYNDMCHFSRDGTLAGIYRKRILVPFGETNPFASTFPGLSEYIRRTTDAASLMPGGQPRLFEVSRGDGMPQRFGVLICYESAFGMLSREYVRNGADFIVSTTNDYWALSKSAMYQHAVMAIFRAIETRTPILRVSNGGFSCYVDERGMYSSSIPVFTQGAMISNLYIQKHKSMGLYVRFGDWFPWLCILISVVILPFQFINKIFRVKSIR